MTMMNNLPPGNGLLFWMDNWVDKLNKIDNQKKNIKHDNPDLKNIVTKFVKDYKVQGFKNQPEVLPHLWWTSKNIWAFRLENDNDSWDIALVDMDSMKATYLFNCYPKMTQNMSYDENDTDFHLTINYDEYATQ